MTPTQFARIGEALYGSQWRLALAVALDVAERTVRRWERDVSPIPEGIAADLARLCRERAAKLTKIADQLEGR